MVYSIGVVVSTFVSLCFSLLINASIYSSVNEVGGADSFNIDFESTKSYLSRLY